MAEHDVLVIGTGSIGERHLRCLLATKRARVAFVEPRAEVREPVARDYDVPGYESVDAALERRFDAAVICSPAPLHVPQARRPEPRPRDPLGRRHADLVRRQHG